MYSNADSTSCGSYFGVMLLTFVHTVSAWSSTHLYLQSEATLHTTQLFLHTSAFQPVWTQLPMQRPSVNVVDAAA